MGNCFPNFLVICGLGTISGWVFFFFAYDTVLKLALPITLGMTPINKTLTLWTSDPVAIYVNVAATKTSPPNPPTSNSTLGGGKLEFEIEMGSWEEEEDGIEKVPLIWVQEDGSFGELNRCVQVLTEGKINYAQVYAVVFGVMCIMTGAGGGVLLALGKT